MLQRVCVCVCARVCVRVCVCVFGGIPTRSVSPALQLAVAMAPHAVYTRQAGRQAGARPIKKPEDLRLQNPAKTMSPCGLRSIQCRDVRRAAATHAEAKAEP